MPPPYQPVPRLDLELEDVPDAPLLDLESPGNGFASDTSSLHSHVEPVPSYRFSRWGVHSPRRIIILVAVIKFTVVMSGMLLLLPSARLLEDLFCHLHYKDDSSDIIDEMKCKVDEVQANLGYLAGWNGLCNSIIGLVVAFPYGMMSDKVGRKPTIIFAWSGLAAAFLFAPFSLKVWQTTLRDDPYVVLLGAFFQLFGGGIPVMLSTLYAVAADVSTEQNKATHFLWLTFGSTAGGIIGPVIAGILMNKYGPWLPIYLVACMVPVIYGILFLLPETLTINIRDQKTQSDVSRPATFKDYMTRGVNELVHSLNMLKNFSVVMILVTFFVQNARFTAYSQTLGQYISKHFGWKLAEVSLLLSPLGILNLIVLGGLPKVSEILMSRRFRMTPFGKDLFLTRVSTCILTIGAIVQGMGHSITIFLFGLFISTFGAADSPLARATVTHYVSPEYTSRLYALIGMIEVIGSFIGGPVIAWCFDQGLKRKGIWTGLPWFYVGFLCSLSWIALWFVKPPKKHSREDPTDSDGDDTDDYMPDDPLRLR
ncbi:mfs transporter [Fusarium albosuccineum]|uniref:Mfs transporter n=1 Tax=Fusarium albosuccineum TaxID=1237068 RepID=A0A8H4LDU1_9HYPO|nr:mfs transporter [Fusarium albosuccineum]